MDSQNKIEMEHIDQQLEQINAVPIDETNSADVVEASAEEIPVVDLTQDEEQPIPEPQPQQARQASPAEIKQFYDNTCINYLGLLYEMDMDLVIIPTYSAALNAVGMKNPDAPYSKIARLASIYAQQMLNQIMDIGSDLAEEVQQQQAE